MSNEKKETTSEELERQIMSSLVPKNEREHWACGEIESLRQQRNDLLEAVDNLVKVKGRHNTEIAWKRMADLVKELKALKEQDHGAV